MEVKLSVLIATMPCRLDQFSSLVNEIYSQVKFLGAGLSVEVLSDNSMEYNIGSKRNKLLDSAKGDYVVFIDDDDKVSEFYIRDILLAINRKPDCVAISGIITFNGKDSAQWYISKDYKRWYQKGNCYYRTPNHISPVRRELALKARFPEISHGEDAIYSKRLLPFLKKETRIYGNIYHYDYYKK